MKRTFKTFTALSLMLLSLVACNGESSNETFVSVKSTSVRGDLSDYYQVIDKQYQLKYNEYSNYYLIEVEIKKLSELGFDKTTTTPYGVWENNKNNHLGFGISYFNKDGNLLKKVSATESGFNGPYSSDQVADLMNIEVGETAIIAWVVNVLEKEDIEKYASFEISSAFEGTQKITKAKTKKSSSAKWNSILDEYENFVDQYIILMKKMNSGDTSVMSEYASCLQSAQTLQQELQNAQNEMTPNQINRLTNIVNKMLKQ